jgi:hypothetical protein
MKVLFRQFLETALFNIDANDNVVLVPQIEVGDGDAAVLSQRGSFSLTDDLFPANCRVRRLPSGEAFFRSLENSFPIDQPVRIFVFPPLLGRRELSDALRAQFPLMDLGEIVLFHVAQMVAPASQIGVLLPGAFFFNESSREGRERLAQIVVPRLIIAQNHPPDVLGLELHAQFRMGTAILEKGGQPGPSVRFFKCPSVDNEAQRSDVLNDFRRLLQQGGGKTKHGYVLRQGLMPGDSWLYDAHHPDLVSRKEDLAQLGGLRTLREFVQILRGIHVSLDANLLIDGAENRGVVLIEGRDINTDGTLDWEAPRHRALVPEERQLQPGDICIRAVQGSKSQLVCAVIPEEMPMATAAHSVIVLRPLADLTAHERGFLLAYLRSSACGEFLRARGLGIHIVPSKLLELPVPVADEALRLAVDGLGNAARQFKAWAEELEAARGSLFDSQSARNARIAALSMGRLAKQRFEAALLVSDFKQRLRTRFPYPIAFRWRTVESQHPTLEGYIQVLECAEVSTTYLAVMALVLAQSVKKSVRWVGEMAKRISTTGHGTNMGDWISILQEAGGTSFSDDIPETAPFVEVSRFQNEQKIKRSLEMLAKMRNDQAHGRGPKGAEVPKAFESAKMELATLLQAVEFVTDYPLRYIETTRRDALRKVTHYDYRELMGDHALVPVSHEQTPDAEIEASSLYLFDRTSKLHLLRPLLIGRECPVCHSWSTFFLDTCLKNGKTVVIKSMEHGHSSEDSGLIEPLRACGLLT